MESITKTEINKELGKIFKEFRLKRKFTQEKIAEELDISVKYISRIENGTGGVKVETLVRYMNILSIPPDILFENLLTNQTLKKDIKLYKKIKALSENKKDATMNIIDIFDNYNF